MGSYQKQQQKMGFQFCLNGSTNRFLTQRKAFLTFRPKTNNKKPKYAYSIDKTKNYKFMPTLPRRILMASSEVKSGALVTLQELRHSSPFFKQGASLRITGKLQEYSLETGIATIIDGNDILKVNTEHLRDLTFKVGSIYQFIGELLIQPENEGVLQARVGRNVDGIDLNLYHQSLLLLRQFQANHLNNPAT